MNVISDLATRPIASATKRTEMVGHTCTPAFESGGRRTGHRRFRLDLNFQL